MQQPGLAVESHRSGGEGSRIIRAGNITNSIVVVGDNNQLQLNSEGNAILNRLLENQRPTIKRRPAPVIIGRPKHPIKLLNRDLEKNSVLGAIQPGNCAEFYSEPGFGKTTLLRYFSSILPMPDGMVFIDRWKTLDDLLQELFDAFFSSSQGYKPGQVGYKRYFENIRALIILDNFSLTREETQILIDTVSNCVFLMASNERHLWDRGNAIHLTGLPLDEAITLFQQQSGRKISRSELPFVKSICNAFQGNPLHIIQAAAQVRDEKISVQKVARQIPGAKPEIQILEGVLKQLSDDAKALLALLATFGNAPLPAEHIASILQNPHLAPLLKNLLNRGLIKAHSPSYSLTGSIGIYLNQSWNLAGWKESALNHFTNWTAHSHSNEQILDAADALMVILENAAAANRWQEVLQIGVAIEPAFVLGRRWGIWERLLNLLRKAGMALKDRAIEAWTLHQLGSQALGLGNLQQAKEFLSGSLAIRRAIGDRSGVAATRHNLKLVRGGPPTGSKGGPTGQSWIIPVIGVVIITILIMIPKNPSYHPEFFTDTFTPSPIVPFITPSPPPSPITPPSITPVTPPSITPVTPPSITPVTPPSITPVTPPSITPVTPPSITPVTPPSITVPPPTPELLLVTDYSNTSDRTMLYQGDSQDFFRVPVYGYIKNQGQVGIGTFDIKIYYVANDGSHWARFQVEGRNYYQDSETVSSLSISKTMSYEFKVMVPRVYEGSAVRFFMTTNRCNSDISCNFYNYSEQLPKVVYDFVDFANRADWYGIDPENSSGYYPLSFNGPVDSRGSAKWEINPLIEDGSRPFSVLGTHPTWVSHGSVQGYYNLNTINFKKNDRLVAQGGFISGGGGDGVTFKIFCNSPIGLIPNELVKASNVMVSYQHVELIPPTQEIHYLYLKCNGSELICESDSSDGYLWNTVATLPNSVVSGSCPYFYLQVDAGETSAQDWAVWVAAYIERP